MTAGTQVKDSSTAAIASSLLAVARNVNQVRTHESLCKRAGVDIDRGGAALLYKLFVEGENVRITELAERLAVDPPAVTRKVQQLERMGLLGRSADPTDARASRLRLTREGRVCIAKLLRAREEWLADRLEGWPEKDKKEFARLLTAFASAIASESEDLP